MPEGILQQMSGNEKDQKEHKQGGSKTHGQQPVILNSDKKHSGDHSSTGGEDAEEETPGLKVASRTAVTMSTSL